VTRRALVDFRSFSRVLLIEEFARDRFESDPHQFSLLAATAWQDVHCWRWNRFIFHADVRYGFLTIFFLLFFGIPVGLSPIRLTFFDRFEVVF